MNSSHYQLIQRFDAIPRVLFALFDRKIRRDVNDISLAEYAVYYKSGSYRYLSEVPYDPILSNKRSFFGEELKLKEIKFHDCVRPLHKMYSKMLNISVYIWI